MCAKDEMEPTKAAAVPPVLFNRFRRHLRFWLAALVKEKKSPSRQGGYDSTCLGVHESVSRACRSGSCPQRSFVIQRCSDFNQEFLHGCLILLYLERAYKDFIFPA